MSKLITEGKCINHGITRGSITERPEPPKPSQSINSKNIKESNNE